MTSIQNKFISETFILEITFVRSGLCIPNMVYLVQFVCFSDGVNLKVVATSGSIAKINRPVYYDVQNHRVNATPIIILI